jgi:hypothetical protein
MTLDASGRLGIGTTSPSEKLEVVGTILLPTNNKIRFQNGNNNKYSSIYNQGGGLSTLTFSVDNDNTTAMYISNSGNVGIGTTSPTYKLDVAGGQRINMSTATTVLEIYNTDTNDGNGVFIKAGGVNSTKYALVIQNAASTNLMTVLANGNVGIGTASPSTTLDVVGTITCTTLTETSTIRIKENVEDIENPLQIVKKLRGVQYNKIGNNNKEIGVIAEEVYDILPQIVNVDDENQPSSVSYGRLTALLIEVVKKQDEQIENLTKRIEELENKL